MDNLFTNKYPYTDLEQLNLSWVIETINKVDTDLSDIREECEQIARDTAQAVADNLILVVDQKILALTGIVTALQNAFNGLNHDVDVKLADMQNQINGFKTYIDTKVQASDNLTDVKIARNNTYIFDVITHELVPQLSVRNFFTGDMVSIQTMFDTLASLHVTDGLSYQELTNKNKSYAEITAYGFSYEDLLLHGNSLIT